MSNARFRGTVSAKRDDTGRYLPGAAPVHMEVYMLTEERVIERIRELIAAGFRPTFERSLLAIGHSRYQRILDDFLKANPDVVVPEKKTQPKHKEHNRHPNLEQAAKPKKSKYATREWRFIAHILKRVEKGGAN